MFDYVCNQSGESYLVSFFAALLVKLDQLVLAWARLDPQVEAEIEFDQKTIRSWVNWRAGG